MTADRNIDYLVSLVRELCKFLPRRLLDNKLDNNFSLADLVRIYSMTIDGYVF